MSVCHHLTLGVTSLCVAQSAVLGDIYNVLPKHDEAKR